MSNNHCFVRDGHCVTRAVLRSYLLRSPVRLRFSLRSSLLLPIKEDPRTKQRSRLTSPSGRSSRTFPPTAQFQIAAYGKGFVQASQDTWKLFQERTMETIVDSDMTSAICFLTGVCSGSICVIVVAAWTARVHQGFTATISLLAFFIGYLMTRIAMALPHACVSCYYACYAENPDNRLFDKTIPDCLNLIETGRDVVLPTPRVPRRFTT